MQRQSFEGLSILSLSGANGTHGFRVRKGRAPPLPLFMTQGTAEVIFVRGRYRPPAGGTKRIINDRDDCESLARGPGLKQFR